MLLVGFELGRLLTILGFIANASRLLDVRLALDDVLRLAYGSHVVHFRLANRFAKLLLERG